MPEPYLEADTILLRPSDGQKWEINPLLESMGVGFLAAALNRGGARVEIIDNFFEQMSGPALVDRLMAYRAPLLGISISHQYPNMWPLFDLIRAFKRERPRTLVVAGGHFASFQPEALLRKAGCDAVAIGEGESTIIELSKAAANGTPLRNVDGLAFLEDGRLVRTRPAPLPELRHVARPLRPYLDLLYRQSPELVKVAWHSVSRSRGCLAGCSYCSVCAFSRLNGSPTWRTRTAEDVITELKCLNQQYGIRRIRFADDEFAGFGAHGESEALAFADAMAGAGLDMRFMISMRVEHVTPRILEPLRRCGLEIVLMGLEAGNSEDLALYRKGITLERANRAIETGLSAGLQVVLALIPFNPWSTLDRVRATLDWVSRQLRPGIIVEPSVLLNRLGPLAGTAVEAMFQRDGLKTDLYLDREAVPQYPFRHPPVERLYAACERVLRPRASVIESAVTEADFELERLRGLLPLAGIAVRRRLFINVRHWIQRQFLDGLQSLARAADPHTEAGGVARRLDNDIRSCRRQFRLANARGAA
jgi:radical SAM superfamily enzyme YgiQ (UPF0313 family)